MIDYQMEAREYHAHEGLSCSQLKHMSRSPAHFRDSLIHPVQPTPAMIFGTTVHHLVLTPSEPLPVVIMPQGLDGRTKEGKAWRAPVGTTPVISHDDFERARNCADSLISHRHVRDALSSGHPEVSMFQEWSYGGTVLRKGRADWICNDGIIADIKTTQDARRDSFQRDFYSMKYYMQAAYYVDLYNDARDMSAPPCEMFAFFAVESEPPHGVIVYRVDPSAIVRGRQEWQRLACLYMDCVKDDKWPCYSEDISVLDLPRWAQNN